MCSTESKRIPTLSQTDLFPPLSPSSDKNYLEEILKLIEKELLNEILGLIQKEILKEILTK